jgi:hypothetical protein
MKGRVLGGLSSGEGLIWAVRDPIWKQEAIKDKGRYTGDYQMVQVDAGVADKRLLVLETEFSKVLAVQGRDRSILGETLRQAWETGCLRTMSKNSPAVATDTHISMIGHITPDELLRRLDSTDIANGYANRFIWLCAKRSKLLPRGGKLPSDAYVAYVAKLEKIIEWAGRERELGISEDAWTLWDEAYVTLTAGRPGLLGALLSRAEAQVLRLACVYAMLDCSATIERHHLVAALALWEYSRGFRRMCVQRSPG